MLGRNDFNLILKITLFSPPKEIAYKGELNYSFSLSTIILTIFCLLVLHVSLRNTGCRFLFGQLFSISFMINWANMTLPRCLRKKTGETSTFTLNTAVVITFQTLHTCKWTWWSISTSNIIYSWVDFLWWLNKFEIMITCNAAGINVQWTRGIDNSFVSIVMYGKE